MTKMTPKMALDYYVTVARIMFRHDTDNALKWLQSKKHNISRRSYFRTLKRLDDTAKQRLYEIANKFDTIAADEIVKFQNIEHQMYEQYRLEESPMKKVMILKAIAELQPMMTALFDQTRQVLEKQMFGAARKDPLEYRD